MTPQRQIFIVEPLDGPRRVLHTREWNLERHADVPPLRVGRLYGWYLPRANASAALDIDGRRVATFEVARVERLISGRGRDVVRVTELHDYGPSTGTSSE